MHSLRGFYVLSFFYRITLAYAAQEKTGSQSHGNNEAEQGEPALPMNLGSLYGIFQTDRSNTVQKIHRMISLAQFGQFSLCWRGEN